MMDEIAAALHEEWNDWYDELVLETANLQITSIINNKYEYWHE